VAEVNRMAAAVTGYAYEAIYGAWWDAIIPAGAPEIVRRSAERYGRALREVLA